MGHGSEDKESQEVERGHSAAAGTLVRQLLRRIIRAVLGVGVAFVPCFLYSHRMLTCLAAHPLPARGTPLVATGVWSPFTAAFKLSF